MSAGTAPLRVFDTHCHLGLDHGGPGDGGDPAAEHARALAAGVTDLVLVGIDRDSSARARELARGLSGARWSAGLHPNDAGRFAAEWDGVRALAAAGDCSAVGETGLDFYRDRAARTDQERSLRAHLQLARELELPVILHCRSAFAALFEVLAGHAPVRGVLHCFSGGPEEAARAVALGLCVSFAGPLTYPKNELLRRAAAAVPDDRVLVETDAPFLPPQAHRGRRNEPAFVRHVLAALAAARGCDEAELAARTHGNAVALFGPVR